VLKKSSYYIITELQSCKHNHNYEHTIPFKTHLLFLTILLIIISGSPIMLGANHIPEDDNSTATLQNSTFGNDSWTSHTSDQEFVCAFYNPDFIIYSSLGSFYIPCFVMIFLYGRIFKVKNIVLCSVLFFEKIIMK
jgi:hypothetical protein